MNYDIWSWKHHHRYHNYSHIRSKYTKIIYIPNFNLRFKQKYSGGHSYIIVDSTEIETQLLLVHLPFQQANSTPLNVETLINHMEDKGVAQQTNVIISGKMFHILLKEHILESRQYSIKSLKPFGYLWFLQLLLTWTRINITIPQISWPKQITRAAWDLHCRRWWWHSNHKKSSWSQNSWSNPCNSCHKWRRS